MRPGVMEYAGKKLKELSAYLGEKKWFAGEKVCNYIWLHGLEIRSE